MEVLLDMKSVSKSFSGVRALNQVSIDVRAGEVLGLAGANGAGKSTLLKIATGVYSRDEGEVFVCGKPVNFKTPREGKDAGIVCIYQELTVIPNLSVAENIFISQMNREIVIDCKKYYERANQILQSLNITFDSRTKVGTLTVANQQMVEIARAISEKAKILIMDEPTSALTEPEKDKLFSLVNNLKKQGLGIVFVTHRMKEIFELCDRVSVMKDGNMLGTYDIHSLDEHRLVELMVSKQIDKFYQRVEKEIGDTILEVSHLSCGDRVKDVSFVLRKGEILGLTGLLGAGRTETVKCLFGLTQPDGGTIKLYGKEVKITSPCKATQLGFGLVPENRKEEGCILKMGIGLNIVFGSKVVTLIRRKKRERAVGQEYIKRLNVVCASELQAVGDLSGGNQQKVIIAKWLLRDADILILDEPTKGIDIAAKKEIHALIAELAKKGTSIIMISSEQDEIMGTCDRAVVLYEGVDVGELDACDFSEDVILHMSHGHRYEKAVSGQ